MDPRQARFQSLRRILHTVLFVLLVIASALTFPSYLPGMVGGWLLIAAAAAARDRSCWMALAAGVLVLIAKGVPLFATVLVLVAVWTLAAALLSPVARWPDQGRAVVSVAALVACAGSWIAFAAQWYFAALASRDLVLDADRSIVCIGDSLTSGMGTAGGYPDALREMVAVPVINLGREGITTAVSLAMIPQMQAARPQAVVIELGGHDFLKHRPRAEVKANLERLIAAAKAAGAEPVLIEVPRGFIRDGYYGIERELAWQHDLALVPDSAIRLAVLWSPHAPPGMWTNGPYLSDDGLHPNVDGSAVLARRVAAALADLFGLGVLGSAPAIGGASSVLIGC